jgi:hypothetical protein
MPRYAPLPSVPLDPRSEAEIVQQASQRVYDASNQTLNDFSSGNPLAALLEGQAFAQGEFLFWANRLPQSILIEWIGPFLGAMRRLGTASTARVLLTIPPSPSLVTIPAGSIFTTNANLTGGEAFSFVSSTAVFIPAGETSVYASVSSQFVGSQYNVPANSITSVSAVGVNNLNCTNPQPAVGGSDVETYQEVQERFFTLIRRRNPVSAEDWQNFFTDFYGVGTITSVQPNRPNQGAYNYLRDYFQPNGQVSFFVLGPNSVELTQDQLERGQSVVNFSVPVESQGHLYPMTLSEIQYNLTLEVDSNGSFGTSLRNSSLNFRDRLFSVLTPGNFFPSNVNPTVSDVDAAFYGTFSTLTRFSDPHIEISGAYNTPPLLESAAATYTQVYEFEPTGYLLNANDLIETTLPTGQFYPVLSSFTPYSSAKADQTVYGNLTMKQIQMLAPGSFQQGDVLYWPPSVGGDGELHIALQNVNIETEADATVFITQGRISIAQTYAPWTVGNSFQFTDGNGVFAPQLVQYDYALGEFIPEGAVALGKRPGALVWEVSKNFTLEQSTNDLTGAQSAGIVGAGISPSELSVGETYIPGVWVYTPQVGSGPDPVADPYYNYVDLTKGVVNKYAFVLSEFTYNPNELTVSEYFDTLVAQGIVREIVVQNGDSGLPIFKYKPRFPVGTYLEYRTDSASLPSYFIAASYFTPTSTSSRVLVDQGLIIELAPSPSQRAQLASELASKTIMTPVKMFTFFKGDRTFFRQGSTVISYTATQSVTPLFGFHIYLQNGIFILTEKYAESQFGTQQYIPFFNPEYVRYAEDTISDAPSGNLFRVMRAFTPPLTVTNWTDTTVTNTARNEEYAGNLLRYADFYSCEQDILSQLGRDVSATKLGVAQITLIPKDSGRFSNSYPRFVSVWENADSATEVPQLSYFTGTTYKYAPPDYGAGTLAL